MSDFAEVLNQTGFDNIVSRYEKDLENFTKSASVSDVHFTGLSSLVSLPLLVIKLE